MKALVDENLSPRLVSRLSDLYPGSVHVSHVGLDAVSDTKIWDFAASRGFVILTQDGDFAQRSLLFGAPPKVVWLRVGNCTVSEMVVLLRHAHAAISAFVQDPDAALLTLPVQLG